MTDARVALHQFREFAGSGFGVDSAEFTLTWVEARVAASRRRRAVGGSLLAVAAATGLVSVLVSAPWTADIPPVQTPSPSVTASPSAAAIEPLSLPCTPPTIIAGKSVGELAGFEGWFNGTSAESMCESDEDWTEWEQLAAAHPATVWINTMDNTMIEAYSRTDLAALGVFATLSGDYQVPDPDPDWPADSAVLIDALTGEVLSSQRFDEMQGFDVETGRFITEDG